MYQKNKLNFKLKENKVSTLNTRINNCQQTKSKILQDQFDMPSLLSSLSTFSTMKESTIRRRQKKKMLYKYSRTLEEEEENRISKFIN